MAYQIQECRDLGAKKLHALSYKMIKQKNTYWGVNYKHEGFPKISGFPWFKFELERPYIVKSRKGHSFTKYKKAPKKYYFGKLINWNYARFGAPMVKIVGAKGEGKSVLLNLLMALGAAKGLHTLSFNDRRMEIRSLAAHGYFEDGEFIPFEIDIFVPKGYSFKRENPLWEYYDNVHKVEFSSSDEIIQAMAPHRFSVVHEEVFTPESTLRLFNDLVEQMAEWVDSKHWYKFAHHELARLIPENPSAEINKLVKRAANNMSNFRKDKIGLDGSFHSPSEVFYRVTQKMGNTLQKSPIDKNRYNRIEKEALGYTKQDFAIKGNGRGWMKHTIKLFPELPDEFRLVPQRRKLIYPGFELEEDESGLLTTMETDLKLLQMYSMRYVERMSLQAIGDYYSMPPSTVNYQVQKLAKDIKKSHKETTND